MSKRFTTKVVMCNKADYRHEFTHREEFTHRQPFMHQTIYNYSNENPQTVINFPIHNTVKCKHYRHTAS